MKARARVFKNVGLRAIHSMEMEELLKLQNQLGLGSDWGFLLFPEDWMPNGSLKQLSARRIDLRRQFKDIDVSAVDFDLAARTVTAGVLLCIASPIYNTRYVQYLAPSSVMSVGRELVKLTKQAARLPPRLDGKLLARLPRPKNSESERKARIEIERFEQFAERGLWGDVPERDTELPPVPSPAGPPREVPPKPGKRVYMPLSDEFLAAAGHRIVWLVETLGPALLDCGRAINQIKRENPLDEGVYQTQSSRRTELSKSFLEKFEWIAPDGTPITGIPFDMQFSGMGKSGEFAWPPRTMAQVRMLLRQLQTAHLFMFLISTGGRISEALSLQPGCIVETPGGIPLANGRTYKLSLAIGGEERDWPLPTIVVQALKQQEELASFAIVDDADDDEEDEEADEEASASDQASSHGENQEDANLEDADEFIENIISSSTLKSIWTREGGNGEVIHGDYNVYLRRLVTVLGLTEELGSGNIHAHRFRKSTGRLIALSILGAPKILMDLFGHKQIGMTLHYILSDPTIRAEMLEVAQAQTIMLAKTAIVSVSDAGGPAAAKVKAVVEAERFRMGEDFGDDSIEALAETLTNNGRSWQLVRPGVLCTKGPQVSGACTPSTAMAEPSRCRAKCDHRLELGFLRDDVNRAIRFAVAQVESAIAEQDEMKAEMWRGQILMNIDRFDSLKAEWTSNAIVNDLLESRKEQAEA
jgi:integrase